MKEPMIKDPMLRRVGGAIQAYNRHCDKLDVPQIDRWENAEPAGVVLARWRGLEIMRAR